MRLRRLQIKNLRCVEAIEVFPKDYTSLIGPNNSGKSAVLRAVELLLNQEKPAVDEWRKGHENEPIEIEADFDNLEDWERNKPGVSSLVHDNEIQLRCRATLADGKADVTYEAKVPEETIEGWADRWSELPQDIKDLATAHQVRDLRSQANKERVRQLVREQMPARVRITGEPRWTSEGISISAALQQALPQAQVIPAVRDAGEDGKPGAKTSFGILIKSIILPAVTGSDEYQSLMHAVRTLEQRLKGEGVDQLPAVRELADQITAKLSDLITAKVTLGMDPPDADKFIGSNTILRLDDGTDTRIALQGHGLQRALVFALLEVLASQRARTEGAEGEPIHTRSTILLFEEPELFMHPHLMRRLTEVLHTIAKRRDWQVIVSTHSPFLVDVAEDPCSLVIHRRSDPGQPPTVKQLTEDPFQDSDARDDRKRLRALLDFHPSVCEAFFAKHVVLVEGDVELAVLRVRPTAGAPTSNNRQSTGHPSKHISELAGCDHACTKDVTIVSCRGKGSIAAIARLLKEFNIPLRVIHDVDRRNRSAEEFLESPEHRENEKIVRLIGREAVRAVDDSFEDVLWERPEQRPKSDKAYNAWKRARELCDGRGNLDHAPQLREIVRFSFAPFNDGSSG